MIPMRKQLFVLTGLILWFLCMLPISRMAYAANDSDGPGGVPHAEALRLGERMYSEGLLPSGEAMQAIVQGDIPVDGTMFSCESCHLKSGMGSVEGRVVTLPTNATELFKPFTFSAEETIPPWQSMPETINWSIRRPAYTDETLATAIAVGIDPSGRELDLTMPRYLLDDEDMAILIYYLNHLSAQSSAGVTASTIRFATVVGDDVAPQEREAMIKVLEEHVALHNGQMRRQEERATKVPFYKKKKTTAYRRFALDVWELHGPPETWRRQLEEYNRQEPVFALVGGLVTGEWRPIHEFCELNRIPCVFPLTDFPVVSDSDWYTLYFSKGYYQEGEAAARFLRGHGDKPKGKRVVQVFRDTPEGRALSRGFEKTRELLGQDRPKNIIYAGTQAPGADFWKVLTRRHPGADFMLWLPPSDLVNLTWGIASSHPERMFLSYGLLGDDIYTLPEKLRRYTYITYPYLLPQNRTIRTKVIKTWLKFRKIPLTNFSIQAKMYAAGWMLGNGVKMISSDYYRDYFLDVFDMMNDENYAIAVYPLLSFGQGQRYASKGCYIVQLSQGEQPELVPKSEWVIH